MGGPWIRVRLHRRISGAESGSALGGRRQLRAAERRTVLVEPVDEDVYGLQEISVNGSTVDRRAQEGLGEALDGIRRMAAGAARAHDVPRRRPQRLEPRPPRPAGRLVSGS
ncbi:hypothetical protein ACFW5I_32205 [Streptomyces sp. NPDC058818]|uniref:hypothetical protein n=1 Tax=Streptomyces sp. NPDC058818 TaxID=3346640 RepID=UPI0036A4E0AD